MILGQTLHVASAGTPLIRSIINMCGLLVSTSLVPFRWRAHVPSFVPLMSDKGERVTSQILSDETRATSRLPHPSLRQRRQTG
jgi:hypothetical protein